MKKALLSLLLACVCLLAVSCGQAAPPDESSCAATDPDVSDTAADTAADTTAEITTAEVTTAEATTAEVTTAEITTEAQTESKETIELKIGSYNIKHAADGGCAAIGKAIADAGLDICGMQEVDHLNTRSSSENQTKKIAEAAGMPYYKFVRAIDYRGGQYGTAILSKYPIESLEITPLYSGSEEGRSVGHAVIDVDGVKIDFFNTHLSYESLELRTTQFKAVADMLASCERFILTADFNTQDFTEFAVLGDVCMVNSAAHRHVTFPGGSSAIDNVITSKNLRGEFCEVITDSHSDHYMLTAKAYIEK